MGERMQYYVALSDKEKKLKIVCVHDQWNYGTTAMKYTKKLVDTLRNTDWSNMPYMDNMEEEYVKNILSMRWHDEPDKEHPEQKYFLHRLHVGLSEVGAPSQADSNYGCVIVDATNPTEIKTGFYSTEGKWQSAVDWWANGEGEKAKKKDFPKQYADESYDKLDQNYYDCMNDDLIKLGEKKEV